MKAHGPSNAASRTIRWAAAVLCAVTALGAGATTASASTIAIVAGGDPVEGVATQIGATGSLTSDNESLFVSVKPSGGAGCGANSGADTGSNLIGSSPPAGPFSRSVNHTFETAGSYLICAWDQVFASNTVTAQDSKTIVVRVPKLSIAVSAPASVSPEQTFQVATTTQAEATRDLYLVALIDTGRGCPANAAAAKIIATTTIIDDADVTGGPATETRNVTLHGAGQYLLCGYLQYDNSSAPPEATSTTVLTVVAPPPPCVVPAVVANEPLPATKARLAAASCAPGALRYVASARYARGSVFRLSPAPGTMLAPGAAVVLFVSTGAPCIVPRIPTNRSLASVKKRLKAADCGVGKITKRRSSSHRRGTVLALTPVTGSRLAPRARVGIVVSSGRSRQR